MLTLTGVDHCGGRRLGDSSRAVAVPRAARTSVRRARRQERAADGRLSERSRAARRRPQFAARGAGAARRPRRGKGQRSRARPEDAARGSRAGHRRAPTPPVSTIWLRRCAVRSSGCGGRSTRTSRRPAPRPRGPAGARANVGDCARGLARALERLYADRALAITVDVPADVTARVPVEDLEEMLGNLLDNACKWAKSRVSAHRCARDITHRHRRG